MQVSYVTLDCYTFFSAYNIRYAAHYGVDDIAIVFPLLQTLEVFTSDNIAKEFSITQNGRSISVPSDTAYLHISQDAGQLKLHVPNEKRRREFCLSRQLPIRLLHHLGAPDSAKGGELGSVITASSLYALNLLLDEDGIIEVAGIPPPENCDESESSTFSTESSLPFSGSRESTATLTQVPDQRAVASPYTPTITTTSSPNLMHLRGMHSPSRNTHVEEIDSSPFTPRTSILSRPVTPNLTHDRPDLYKNLLDAVIKQASSLRSIPAAGDVLTTNLSAGSSIEIGPAIDSAIPGENLIKIGAAGELFVCEKYCPTSIC